MLHNLLLTPPHVMGVATYPPGASYGPRLLRDFEFVWIIDGDVEYRYNADRAAAPAGSIVLCQAGSRDLFLFDPQRQTRHGYFHFNIRSIPADWPMRADWPVVRSAREDGLLRALFRHLLTAAGDEPAPHRDLTIAHLLAAFVIGGQAGEHVSNQSLPAIVERVQAYIDERLEDDAAARICLADLAAVAGVNAEHLCRVFRTATGRSPMKTVRLARLDRAAVLLARSNYAVNEIAMMYGFASPYHFSRRFKEAYGDSPRAVRRQVRAGALPPTPCLPPLGLKI